MLLQKGVDGKHTLSIQGHSNNLRAQVEMQNTTIKTVRKQLVDLGVMVSNMAEKAIQEKEELKSLAESVIKSINEHKPAKVHNDDEELHTDDMDIEMQVEDAHEEETHDNIGGDEKDGEEN